MRNAIPLAILVVPPLATCTASILYVVGGGFGGGHGPYDYWMYWLGMPAILLLEKFPERWLVWVWEPVWLMALPGFVNFLLFALIATIVHHAVADRQHPGRRSDG